MEYFLDLEGIQSINNRLYKYSAINENLYSSLNNSELWFNDPLNFNDPYDCNINYDFSDVDYEKIYAHLVDSNKKFNYQLSDAFLRKRTEYICNNPIGVEQLMNDFLKDVINKRGISCFSESDSALLMWSHYADSHKGVCLTFDMEKDEQFFNIPYKVAYPATYPKMNPFADSNGKEVQLILATKSQEWEYEKEIRVIKEKDVMKQYRGAIKFAPEALTEIKFGYKISVENVKGLKNVITDKYPHIKFYGSKLKKGQFGIQFFPIHID